MSASSHGVLVSTCSGVSAALWIVCDTEFARGGPAATVPVVGKRRQYHDSPILVRQLALLLLDQRCHESVQAARATLSC